MDNYNSEDDDDDEDDGSDEDDDDDDGEDDDEDESGDADSGDQPPQTNHRSEVNFSDMQSYGNGHNGMYSGQAQGFGGG